MFDVFESIIAALVILLIHWHQYHESLSSDPEAYFTFLGVYFQLEFHRYSDCHGKYCVKQNHLYMRH